MDGCEPFHTTLQKFVHPQKHSSCFCSKRHLSPPPKVNQGEWLGFRANAPHNICAIPQASLFAGHLLKYLCTSVGCKGNLFASMIDFPGWFDRESESISPPEMVAQCCPENLKQVELCKLWRILFEVRPWWRTDNLSLERLLRHDITERPIFRNHARTLT